MSDLKYRNGTSIPYYPNVAIKEFKRDNDYEVFLCTWLRIKRGRTWYDVLHQQAAFAKTPEKAYKMVYEDLMESVYLSQLFYKIHPKSEFNPKSPIQIAESNRLARVTPLLNELR